MTTARDLITSALQNTGVIGVGQTPLSEDMNDALTRLNRMLGQWNRQRWLVFHTVDVTAISTGFANYTVGLGGQFNCQRPDKLEDGCFVRQFSGTGPSNGSDFNSDFNSDFGPSIPPQGTIIDYPLTVLSSQEDYNRETMKYLSSWPLFVYYDASMVMGTPVGGNPSGPQYPYGYARFYPVPQQGQFEIHLLIKDVLQQINNLSNNINFPPEYEEALEYNLTLRLCAKYQVPAMDEVKGLAATGLETIRGANFKIPVLQMPADLAGQGNHYNVYSDQSY